jgi:hypothetical protein
MAPVARWSGAGADLPHDLPHDQPDGDEPRRRSPSGTCTARKTRTPSRVHQAGHRLSFPSETSHRLCFFCCNPELHFPSKTLVA